MDRITSKTYGETGDQIQVDIDETRWKIMDWIYMAWNREKQRVRVNTVMKFIMCINNQQMRFNFMMYFYL